YSVRIHLDRAEPVPHAELPDVDQREHDADCYRRAARFIAELRGSPAVAWSEQLLRHHTALQLRYKPGYGNLFRYHQRWRHQRQCHVRCEAPRASGDHSRDACGVFYARWWSEPAHRNHRWPNNKPARTRDGRSEPGGTYL